MIELISSLFKEGDFIRLFFNNSSRSVEGTIIKILPSSIAIKTAEGKICGVKGDDIDSFDSDSTTITTVSVTEEQTNIEPIAQTSDTGSSFEEKIPSAKETSDKEEEIKEESEPAVQAPKFELKTIGKIPLEELQRRMGGTKPKVTKEKKKLTSLGSDFNALSSLVEEDHAKDNQKIVPALGSIRWISADGRPFGCILDGK